MKQTWSNISIHLKSCLNISIVDSPVSVHLSLSAPHLTSPLAPVSVQIISSSTPCGDFFFRGCRTSESQRVDVVSSRTSSSSKSQSSVLTEDRTSDITNIVKKCNELDLNIIVIWKVHITVR